MTTSDELLDALVAIDEAARQGKIAVESVTVDAPVFVLPNVAVHHFHLVRLAVQRALTKLADADSVAATTPRGVSEGPAVRPSFPREEQQR